MMFLEATDHKYHLCNLRSWFSYVPSNTSNRKHIKINEKILRETWCLWGTMSFEGKVHLIKSIGISQLTYAMDMMNVEDKVISETGRIIYQFLCSDKRYTIKKDVYTLPRNMGGLGMIDVLALIKAKRITFFIQVLKRAEQKWAKLPLKYIKCLDNDFCIPFFTDGTGYYRFDWKEKYSLLL